MCVIAVKPKGRVTKKMWEWIENCWDNNPDGAGMMYWNSDGSVQIAKGYFNFAQFKADVTKYIGGKQAVLHFRIATHGTVSSAMCHPFPITHNTKLLQATTLNCEYAVAHNGILSQVQEDKHLSDTAIFTRDYLSNLTPRALVRKGTQNLIALLGSKFAFMTREGIYTVGTFEADKHWYFSNNSYKYPYIQPVKYVKDEDWWKKSQGESDITPCEVCGINGETYFDPDTQQVLCVNCFTDIDDEIINANKYLATTTDWE